MVIATAHRHPPHNARARPWVSTETREVGASSPSEHRVEEGKGRRVDAHCNQATAMRRAAAALRREPEVPVLRARPDQLQPRDQTRRERRTRLTKSRVPGKATTGKGSSAGPCPAWEPGSASPWQHCSVGDPRPGIRRKCRRRGSRTGYAGDQVSSGARTERARVRTSCCISDTAQVGRWTA